MQFKHYELIGAGVAVAICNEAPTTAQQYTAILRAHLVDDPELSTADAGVLRTWSDALRSAFSTAPEQRHEVVNQLMSSARCTPRLVAHDGLPAHLHFAPSSTTGAARIKAITAGGLAIAIATIGAERLGLCANPGCETVYIDRTKAGRQLYCSVRCANRVRVARHRNRQRRNCAT